MRWSSFPSVPGLTAFGPDNVDERAGVISFTLGDIHAHDVSSILDSENIAVRAGHHCAQPLMDDLGVTATTRASLYIYNTKDDVDRLISRPAQGQQGLWTRSKP